MVRGVRITASRIPIAASIRFSNAWLRFRGTADFASPIHSQPIAARENREGGIGVLGRKTKSR